MKFCLPSNKSVWLIGDPHLGRRFETGVPLHRRGEREKRQLAKFQAELAEDVDININVGDTFEHPFVGFSVVLDAFMSYRKAAENRPQTMFYIIAGNHDIPRNLEAVGALDVLEQLLDGISNIKVIREETVADDILMLPWVWGRTDWEVSNEPYSAVVGHCDVQSYGGDDSHILPVHLLDDVPLYVGHDHLPGDVEVEGRIVHRTGSLEPFSHSQDPEGEIYVTLTLAEYEQRDDLKDKMVRILLSEGEELPLTGEYLALTGKRVVEEKTSETVSLEGFDWKKTLDEKLAPLTPAVREFINERLKQDELC